MRAVRLGAVLSILTLCVATVACDDKGASSGCPAGTAGCACYDDGTCDTPLDCAFDSCVILPPYCGDGTINGSEACDDGYKDACGTCNIDCTGPGTGLDSCGDGEVCPESGETCDDGFTDACGGCNADCTGAGSGLDCDAWQLCTCAGTCINPGTCKCDADCGPFNICNTGTGLCERDYSCAATSDCPGTERCSSVNDCILIDACRVDLDCDAGEICSRLGACDDVRFDDTECMCLSSGICRNDDDCSAADYCVMDPWDPIGNCYPDDYCEDDFHCRPGHVCNLASHACELDSNSQCTTNDLTTLGCGWAAVCCSTGVPTDCCREGKRCAFTGSGDCAAGECVCIRLFTCLDDPDCPADFTCDLTTDTCIPMFGNCTVDAECFNSTEYCSTTGTCINRGTCASDADCNRGGYIGERCNSMFTCAPAERFCAPWPGPTQWYTPNVLLVLDRSGSMGACEGSTADGCCGSLGCVGVGVPCSDETLQCIGSTATATRWSQAVQLIDELTLAHTDSWNSFRFGIDVFPRRCGSGGECSWPDTCAGHVACGIDCNSCSCDDTCTAGCGGFADSTSCTNTGLGCAWVSGGCQEPVNFKPGVIDIAVGFDNRNEIKQFVAATFPGGGTPLGPTLRNIWNDPSAASLDDPTRQNAIILFTDSEPSEDPGAPWDCTQAGCTCGTGNSTTEAACRVNFVLDGLRLLSPSVKTYVVGFGSETPSASLNCYAVHGGTSGCLTPEECQTHTTADECDGPPGCTWNGYSCDGSGCQVYVTQRGCRGPAGCIWNGSSCDGVDETTCASTSETCYYDGYDSVAMWQAFGNNIAVLTSCSFNVGPSPTSGSNVLVVYMLYDNPLDMPADCSNPTLQLCRMEEGPTTYLRDVAAERIDFFTPACDVFATGRGTPVILWECWFNDGG